MCFEIYSLLYFVFNWNILLQIRICCYRTNHNAAKLHRGLNYFSFTAYFVKYSLIQKKVSNKIYKP